MTDHIVSNQVKCLSCGEDIFSAHRHDYVQCKCGKVAVDGGNEFIRRVGHRGMYEEKSIVLPNELVEDITNAMQWGVDTYRNPLGLAYAALRAIRDAGYQVVPKEGHVNNNTVENIAESVEDDDEDDACPICFQTMCDCGGDY